MLNSTGTQKVNTFHRGTVRNERVATGGLGAGTYQLKEPQGLNNTCLTVHSNTHVTKNGRM